MPRFRGMIRGFASVAASEGFGLGAEAISIRFLPQEGWTARLERWLVEDVLPVTALRRGIASIQLFKPSAPPPMTKEQSIRGMDGALPWVLLATAYDRKELMNAAKEDFSLEALELSGAAPGVETGNNILHYAVTSAEVARTAPHPKLPPGLRGASGRRAPC